MQTVEEEITAPPPPPLPWGELMERFPTLRPPLIEGLLRKGETMNIIANSKVGKSWLVNDLALAVATGQPWLGRYPTHQGRVLIIDNELHHETIAHRLRQVAACRGIEISPDDDRLTVWPLRGRLLNMNQIKREVQTWERGEFAFVIMDAFYRTLPPDTDENANADMAEVYNAVDTIADHAEAGIGLVHHASKGGQSEKAVTDVGSGAGAISRAADTHMILRRHEEEGAYVLDLALRSWPPALPICLRWHYPRWELAPELDPAKLWTGKKAKAEDKPKEEWDPFRFAKLCPEEPTHPATLLFNASKEGLAERKAKSLMEVAIQMGYLAESPRPGDKRGKNIYRAHPPHPP